MRRLLVSLLLIMALTLISSVALARSYPNEPEGFNDLSWGTSLGTVKDEFVFYRQIHDMSFYKRSNETFSIDGARFYVIEYGFKDGKFECVSLWVNDLESYVAILNDTTQKYGPGETIEKDIQGKFIPISESWFGDKTTIILPRYHGKPINLWFAKAHQK